MKTRETEITPAAVALFTRSREEDYSWVHEAGKSLLLPQVRSLHLDCLADRDARPAATLLLVADGDRVGLLAANLRSPRRDHMGTTIEDTLFIEVEIGGYEALARLAADLLRDDGSVNRQRLLDYAEAVFRDRPSAVGPLKVVETEQVDGDIALPTSNRMALRSTPENRRRIASALYRSSGWPAPMLLMSTGLVSNETLQKIDSRWLTVFALSKSSSLPEEGEVLLTGQSERSVAAGGFPSRAAIVGGLVLVVAGAVSVVRSSLARKAGQDVDGPKSDEVLRTISRVAAIVGFTQAPGGIWPASGLSVCGDPEREK